MPLYVSFLGTKPLYASEKEANYTPRITKLREKRLAEDWAKDRVVQLREHDAIEKIKYQKITVGEIVQR